MKWSRKKVVVTGGAGFIGGEVVGRLLDFDAEVVAVDYDMFPDKPWLWPAKLKRLSEIYATHGRDPQVETINLYTEREKFKRLARGADVVFHLAAVFGGREFVDIHQTECSQMLAVDQNVISASYEAGVGQLHYASSACVYAPSLNRPGRLLREDDILSTAEGWASSDNLYGFAKLMAELQLKVLFREHDFRSSVSRYLTVYGPGEFDSSHAIASLIEKALRKDDPYVIWGSGRQERGFTYVSDIARGSILAAEKIHDGTPINLGWDKRYAIREVGETILSLAGHKPREIRFDKNRPEGPFSRALDISRAKELLDWTPSVGIVEGLARTIEWHRNFAFSPTAEELPVRVERAT